jgi:hypothetical protein
LLFDNLNYWKDYLDSCARAIETNLHEFGLDFDVGERNSVFGFIDNTLRKT